MDKVEASPEHALIDAIISMYHTTRLSDVPAAVHIMGKPSVQRAFEAYRRSVLSVDAAALERVAEALKAEFEKVQRRRMVVVWDDAARAAIAALGLEVG